MDCDGNMIIGVLVPLCGFLFGIKRVEGTFAWEDADISGNPM